MTQPEGHPGDYKDNDFQEMLPDSVDFDGGAFTISYLATDPDGFKVATSDQLSRRQGHDGSLFTPDQANKLRRAVRSEIKFQGGEDVHQARLDLQEARAANVPGSAIDSLTSTFEKARQKYVKGMIGKVGVRNVEVLDNTLSLDVKTVAFPMYTQFSGPENSAEILDVSSLTGTAMAVRTTDNRIIIQHRSVAKQRLDAETLSRGNEVYADIPGASVAGLLDATIDLNNRSKDKPPRPDRVDTDFVRAAALKEGDEELGLGLHDLSKLRIVGMAHDNIKVHDEFLILTDARLSAAELREQSRTANRNRHLGDADFEEKFVDIEASPQAIETLLCYVQCPLPPTHSALMVASGYSMVLQTQGLEAADEWKARLETRIAENYSRIDQRVSDFYKRHPEAIDKVPERYWDKNIPPRNLNGYSPMYTPQEQGLPSFEDEMVWTGLTPEKRKIVDEAYLFDVDGPLTDPQEHKVTEPELVDIIAAKLDSGVPVGLNTGRATEWAIEKFVTLLAPKLKDKASFSNLIVIGEMGGTWATFNENGEATHNKSRQLTIPENLKATVKKIVEEKYGDTMFFDGDRESMCSIIMNEGGDITAFDEQRLELAQEIESLVAASEDAGRLKVGQTTIATDINVKYAGKDLGAERFQEWLDTKHTKPRRYITFGDSASDIEMAKELDRNGENVTFVFVGPSPVTNGLQSSFHIVHAPGYSSATLKVLKSVGRRA